MSDVLRKLYEGVSGESHTYPRSRVDGANVADWKYVEWLESKVARPPAIDRVVVSALETAADEIESLGGDDDMLVALRRLVQRFRNPAALSDSTGEG